MLHGPLTVIAHCPALSPDSLCNPTLFNLIVDCLIVDGNPADSSLTVDMLDRQKELYGRYPLKVALDGGFASKDNLKKAKEKQIKDVCFAKKRGLEVEDMCRSQWVYDRLRRFRAGIESGISWVKRCFGLTRCTWKGLRSFKSHDHRHSRWS